MWFTAAAQLIGSELQSQPLSLANPYAVQQSSPWGTIAMVLGGVLVLGGIYYAVSR